MREFTFKAYAANEPSFDAQVCVKLGLTVLSDKVEAGSRVDRKAYAELVDGITPLLVFERVNTAAPGAPEQWMETIRMRFDGGTVKVSETAFQLLTKAWEKVSAEFPAREAPLLVKVDAYLEDVPVVNKGEEAPKPGPT